MPESSRRRLLIVVTLMVAIVQFAMATAVSGPSLLLWVGGLALVVSAGVTVFLQDKSLLQDTSLTGSTKRTDVITTFVVAAAIGARVAILGAA